MENKVHYYEFVLKTRDSEYSPWDVKYRCVTKERFDFVKEKYVLQCQKDPRNSLLLINELDSHGDFIRVIL